MDKIRNGMEAQGVEDLIMDLKSAVLWLGITYNHAGNIHLVALQEQIEHLRDEFAWVIVDQQERLEEYEERSG